MSLLALSGHARVALHMSAIGCKADMPFCMKCPLMTEKPDTVPIQCFDRSRSATRRAISAGASRGMGNTELTLISPST